MKLYTSMSRRRVVTLLTSVSAAVSAPARSSSTEYNIRDFGAKGDGTTIDSNAINQAIAVAAARGGGVVLVPPGSYACHTVHLQSRVSLHLLRGATLLAAPYPDIANPTEAYDAAEPQLSTVEPFQDFGHNHWRNSLIYGENLFDVSIYGEGLIYGKGLSKGPAEGGLPREDVPGVANKAIGLKNCHNISLRNFSILKGGHFAVLATGVDNLTIDGLTVDTDRDGFDIDCCQNVQVTNCRVNSPWDDGIVPKSSMALGYARPTRNVVISNCYVTGGYEVGSLLDGSMRPFANPHAKRLGRIKLGTESNGGFYNIAISNCIFDTSWGLALESVDGAIIEDVTISNIVMRNCLSTPLFIRLGARMRGPSGSKPGAIRRININNITCSGESSDPIIIAGLPEAKIEQVSLSQITYLQNGGGLAWSASQHVPEKPTAYPEPDMFGALPAYGLYLRHTEGIDVTQFRIAVRSPDLRAAVYIEDSADINLNTLSPAPGTPRLAMRQVDNIRVADCLTIPDQTFAHVGDDLTTD